MSVKLGLRFCSKIVACGLLLGSLLPVSVQAQTLTWKQLLGSSGSEGSSGVATGRGNVYISGSTTGSLAGPNNAGADAWVARYEGSGVLVWKRQLGLFGPDVISNNVASDSSFSGNVYITGSTTGSLAASNQGGNDAWVAKYDFSGALLWKRQLGTSKNESSLDVASDSVGNVYISGFTSDSSLAARQQGTDAWVAKYNSVGTLLWKQQLSNKVSQGVATDSKGNVYITGYTTIRQGDAWVAKYNSIGTLVWQRQLGTGSSDTSYAVATDSKDNVYISGSTDSFLAGVNQGSSDAWVAKYNSAGTREWKHQLGTSSPDNSYAVATDSLGNVYISGDTRGSLGGAFIGTDPEASDAWVAKYSTTGKLVWKDQFGTSSRDTSAGIATDGIGNVYISGGTTGSLGGASQGLGDAFVVKYTQ